MEDSYFKNRQLDLVSNLKPYKVHQKRKELCTISTLYTKAGYMNISDWNELKLG